MTISKPELTPDESRIVEMAWEDRTSFDAIERLYGLGEAQVIELMRRAMKRSSFKMWRERVTGRATKHDALRSDEVTRHKASHRRHTGL
jgi:uncharacterized protein (TIGR03643 family)